MNCSESANLNLIKPVPCNLRKVAVFHLPTMFDHSGHKPYNNFSCTLAITLSLNCQQICL